MLYALRVCCPVHNLPYESIVFTNNSSQFLRCSECPQDKNSLKLAT